MASNKRKIEMGCPSCGGSRIIMHARVPTARPGCFVAEPNGSYEFHADHETVKLDEIDDDTSDEVYECDHCGESFDTPGRIREGTDIRVVVKLNVEAYRSGMKKDAPDVEQEVEDLAHTEKFEFYCVNGAQAKNVAETLRLMVGGVVNTAKGST